MAVRLFLTLFGHTADMEPHRVPWGLSLIHIYLAQGLSKGGTAEFQVVETEVYMINGSLFIVNQHRRYDCLDVGNFSTDRNNYRARRNYFAAVGVFLCHGKRVFTSRYIDLQGAAAVSYTHLPYDEDKYNVVLKYSYDEYPSNPNGSDY